MAIPEVPPEAGSQTISIGETLVAYYGCPCTEVYEAGRAIAIDGYRTIRPGSIWEARYRNIDTGSLYLVSDSYHRQVAVVLDGSLIDVDAAVVQYLGPKNYRSWGLVDASDANQMRFAGYSVTRPSWQAIYLGTDGTDASVVRMSVEEINHGTFSEQLGQIEYRHDMKNGNEFVIRGARVRIDELAGDGLLTFTVMEFPK